jgi:hypothetical protein
MRRLWIVIVSLFIALNTIAPVQANTVKTPMLGDSIAGVAAHPTAADAALVTANPPVTTTIQAGQTLLFPAPALTTTALSSVYGRVRGGAIFTRRIRAALDWLQAHDPDAYQRVEAYVTLITVSPYAHRALARPLPGGGCAVRALARWDMSVMMTAAMLYHEATHCYQFATVGAVSSKEAEVFAYTEQIAFMERNGFAAEEIDYYQRVLDYYASQPDDGRYIPPPDF